MKRSTQSLCASKKRQSVLFHAAPRQSSRPSLKRHNLQGSGVELVRHYLPFSLQIKSLKQRLAQKFVLTKTRSQRAKVKTPKTIVATAVASRTTTTKNVVMVDSRTRRAPVRILTSRPTSVMAKTIAIATPTATTTMALRRKTTTAKVVTIVAMAQRKAKASAQTNQRVRIRRVRSQRTPTTTRMLNAHLDVIVVVAKTFQSRRSRLPKRMPRRSAMQLLRQQLQRPLLNLTHQNLQQLTTQKSKKLAQKVMAVVVGAVAPARQLHRTTTRP